MIYGTDGKLRAEWQEWNPETVLEFIAFLKSSVNKS